MKLKFKIKDKESEDGLKSNISLKLFPKLNKDPENLEVFYEKYARRFRACCLTLGYLCEPWNEPVVINMRPVEIITFLKRMFFFDLKKKVKISKNMHIDYKI